MIAFLFTLWNLAQWLRDTNSHAAAVHGQKAYAQRKYDDATAAYGKANALAPTAANAFNLGTAQIAAGKREEGASTLLKAMNEPALRADALYNRGNSALEAKAYDYAVRDYAEALRLRPSDARAKRNLEIALARKSMQQQSSSGKQKNGAGGASQQKPQPRQPAPSAQKSSDNSDALLRAVQQQESEEQQRMRKAGRERVRVGW